ncbi:MAG: class II fumarate hydratase [Pseudohongiellaceae bacterium]
MAKSTFRTETDSLGDIQVPVEALWGAQTQRSLQFFAIGDDRFPSGFIHDFVLVKKACALANLKLGHLDPRITELISNACDQILAGKHADQFPLSVWQTGSGTQTNMNVNEVIANLANQAAGSDPGSKSPVHPNDHVNLSQSSNDVFPTVMHVVTTRLTRDSLLPALNQLLLSLADKRSEFSDRVKTGRTHMMDATPVTLGQEFGGYHAQLDFVRLQIELSLPALQSLALGGTAVGTGLNSSPGWAEEAAATISKLAGFEFKTAPDKFSQLAAHDALASMHNQLTLLATALNKMASDLRLMASGPRCGLAEINLPANEPGSSIMPGKVNPTQIEALTMVCIRILGNNTTVSFANSQGQFELNVYKPLIIHTVMESLTLLTDAMSSFEQHCLRNLTANDQQLDFYLDRSLMLVTALTPVIGYDNAARAAKLASAKNLSLRDAVLQLKLMGADEFDKLVDPLTMLGPR